MSDSHMTPALYAAGNGKEGRVASLLGLAATRRRRLAGMSVAAPAGPPVPGAPKPSLSFGSDFAAVLSRKSHGGIQAPSSLPAHHSAAISEAGEAMGALADGHPMDLRATTAPSSKSFRHAIIQPVAEGSTGLGANLRATAGAASGAVHQRQMSAARPPAVSFGGASDAAAASPGTPSKAAGSPFKAASSPIKPAVKGASAGAAPAAAAATATGAAPAAAKAAPAAAGGATPAKPPQAAVGPSKAAPAAKPASTPVKAAGRVAQVK